MYEQLRHWIATFDMRKRQSSRPRKCGRHSPPRSPPSNRWRPAKRLTLRGCSMADRTPLGLLVLSAVRHAASYLPILPHIQRPSSARLSKSRMLPIGRIGTRRFSRINMAFPYYRTRLRRSHAMI